MPVFMAATPEFVAKSADTIVAYLKAWLEVARDFKDNPNKVADTIYGFYAGKGYSMSQETFRKALRHGRRGAQASLPIYNPTCSATPRYCSRRRRSRRMPDWSKALQARVHGQGARVMVPTPTAARISKDERTGA